MCCCYPGSFRASVADSSAADLILQLAGGLLEKGNFSDLETGSTFICTVNADSVTFRHQKRVYKIKFKTLLPKVKVSFPARLPKVPRPIFELQDGSFG